MINKNQLDNINILRIIATLIIVVYHSYAIYSGAWELPVNCNENEFNWWVSKIIAGCSLEIFVFIPGYICALQLIQLNKKKTLMETIKAKMKRLILPSIFFSIGSDSSVCYNLVN